MRYFKILLVGLLVLAAAFSVAVYVATYHPDAVERQAVDESSPAPTLQAGQSLKVLSWNVQFLAGNSDNHFFYDGGSDPWPTRQRTEDIARRMAALINKMDPDIILFQELDEGADRTHNTNQLEMIRAHLKRPYPVLTEAWYWKAAYVPHPAILGSAGMKLSILSKYKIASAARHALPAIVSDDILTRQFNIKRAVQEVLMPVEGGNDLVVFNTHLSAFAQGDETMALQVAKMQSLIDVAAMGGRAWLAGGDYNLLAADSVYNALPRKVQAYYNPAGTELAPMMAAHQSVPSLEQLTGDEAPEWFTHMPSNDPARKPNKTIDYIFYGGMQIADSAVLLEDGQPLSDHLPVWAVFTLPGE